MKQKYIGSLNKYLSLTVNSDMSSSESCYRSFTVPFLYHSGFEVHPVLADGDAWMALVLLCLLMGLLLDKSARAVVVHCLQIFHILQLC